MELFGVARIFFGRIFPNFSQTIGLIKFNLKIGYGQLFFDFHEENWIFVKICKNFSFTCHSDRKNLFGGESKTEKNRLFSYNVVVWQKFGKIRPKNMCATPKSSTYGALHPKPWVALKNLTNHFVPYNPLNKLSVHQNSVGSIFLELHHFFSQWHAQLKFLRILTKIQFSSCNSKNIDPKELWWTDNLFSGL